MATPEIQISQRFILHLQRFHAARFVTPALSEVIDCCVFDVPFESNPFASLRLCVSPIALACLFSST
jgi:hypothetical protein